MLMWIIFILSVMSFSFKRKHLLMMLLSLEMLIILIYMNLFELMFSMGNEYYMVMLFLAISVCESALGLSILVSLIRTHGNDYFQSFSIVW